MPFSVLWVGLWAHRDPLYMQFRQRGCGGGRGEINRLRVSVLKWPLKLSNGSHPFRDEEVLGSLLTETGRPAASHEVATVLTVPFAHARQLCSKNTHAISHWRKCLTSAWRRGVKHHSEFPSMVNGNAFNVVLMMCNIVNCRSIVIAFFSFSHSGYMKQILTHPLKNYKSTVWWQENLSSNN